MTREEALKIVRENYPHFGTTEPWLDLEKALATLIPELAESEDERTRKWILEKVQGYASSGIPCSDEIKMADKAIDYLEKQKDLDKMIVVSPEVWDQAFADAYENGKKEGEKQEEQKPNVEICPHSIKSKSYSETGYYPIEDCDYGLELALLILEKTIGKVQGFQTDDGIREHQTAIEAVRKAKEQKEIPLMNGDADLYFDDLRITTKPLTSREWFNEGIKYAQRLQKEQKPKDITLSREDCLHQLFENGTITMADYLYLTTNRREQKPAEKQDYSGLNDLERAIHRGFLSAGVENVPVTIIKETAKGCLAQMKPAEWSEEDDWKRKELIQYLEEKGDYRTVWMTWLKSLLERLNLQSKEEWSEEKKQTTKNTHPEEYPLSPAECISPREYGLFKQLQQECIETIEQELYSLGKEHEKDDDSRIKFLKSLRPSWKPSEEQMKALERTVRLANFGLEENRRKTLIFLYEQLKKLM